MPTIQQQPKKEDLEKQALILILEGKTNEQVEKELKHEFIFFKDTFTGKYTSVTLWR